MPELTYAKDADTGAVTLTLALSPAQARAVGTSERGSAGGPDALDLANHFDTVMEALTVLRTGSVPSWSTGQALSAEDWHVIISAVFADLLPYLQGLGDAALRIAHGLGMSYADIALAMDAPRSTVQSRVQKVTGRPASEFESWALGGDAATALARFAPMVPDAGKS